MAAGNPFGAGEPKGNGGNNFVTNPRGNAPMPKAPPDFIGQQAMQKPKQMDANPQDKAPGPSTAAEVVTPGVGMKPSGFIGTVPSGGPKPFKLG
jgi:hypothetical protein